ncbi:LysM peptidoglycan-binding domain-containing protein [Pseudomonas aeruginosa]|uniref:LysM peptidoglycan-binding domain-containing protein n=1 Tax=Pseudomonas aeruginosa TaxID=287 RepID=UPI0003D6D4A7|nr:hypothetical protein [Pseudomonas aeruginosa]HCL2778273.1 hypothetical protein [Pseudomonas aeruginosa AC9A]AHC75464.1 Hypothetical protein SCV20265_1350 [Pseudomonas aeruginosa SCV20265]WCV50456.1 hypothetical protein KKY57_06665 [Pseudomonas aeruginosa]WCV56528.1 hypothetical protein KKY71_06665 [Pseudomonas aeruginosa]HBO0031481.1 hypothetical protein [Pseudomonas aeruginosa]
MNKANECTCPSGDGSLVHPCPAHPAVEQAGGDEHEPLPYWEPCNLGCDPEFNGKRSRHCAQAQQIKDLDKQCRDDVARALGLRPNQERGFAWSYLLASIKSCVKASGDSAQAQHSVPEGYALIPVRETEAMHDAVMALLYKGVARTDTQKLLDAYIAAAPGNSAQHSVPAYVSYTTQPAESLAGIALRQLKDESRWVEIRDINAHAFPDMRSHSYYPAGTVIKLPAAAPSEKRSCEHAGCCNTAHPGTSLCIAHHSKKAQERLLAAAPGKEVGHE